MNETTDNMVMAFRVECGDSTDHGDLTKGAAVTYTKTYTAIDQGGLFFSLPEIKQTKEHPKKTVLLDHLSFCYTYSGWDVKGIGPEANSPYSTHVFQFEEEGIKVLQATFDKVTKAFVDVYAMEVLTVHKYRKAAIQSFLTDLI